LIVLKIISSLKILISSEKRGLPDALCRQHVGINTQMSEIKRSEI
jgi:hypothetical protein